MKKLIILAAMAFMTATSAVAQNNDVKSTMGVDCLPKKFSQAEDFRFSGGAIKNIGNKRLDVFCALEHDRFDTAPLLNDLDDVTVYITMPNGASDDFVCTTSIKDLDNNNTIDSATASTGASGNQVLSVGPLDFIDADFNQALVVLCKIPAKATLIGIRWEEDEFTDTDGGGN